MTEKKWSFKGGVIVGTDICEDGIPHTNRSVVTHLNRYERIIWELEEENEELKQFKELLCAVLKQEYEDRTNEMNMWAEKEDWNGYGATKLEYGTVIRIAKRIGVDLDD